MNRSKIEEINCPECKSKRYFKDGICYTKDGEIQRFLCGAWGYRFSH